jgi:hypothetical protein
MFRILGCNENQLRVAGLQNWVARGSVDTNPFGAFRIEYLDCDAVAQTARPVLLDPVVPAREPDADQQDFRGHNLA